MRELKVAVVVGHDKKAQGAVGANGQSEWYYNKKVANKIVNKLSDKWHIKAKVFFRDPDISGYSKKMTELHTRLQEWGADIAIELHFNSAENQKIDGAEVLYCSERGGQYAEILQKEFVRHLEAHDRGIKKKTKKDRGGGFLCRGRAICLIGEPFFASHIEAYNPDTVATAYADVISTIYYKFYT